MSTDLDQLSDAQLNATFRMRAVTIGLFIVTAFVGGVALLHLLTRTGSKPIGLMLLFLALLNVGLGARWMLRAKRAEKGQS
jgi:hypothetical protein